MVSREDGLYLIGMLPPGEYLVVAADPLSAYSSTATSTLEMLVPHATHVILAEGERRTVDVRIADIRRE